jgi:chromosome partitioning protein
MKTIAFFNNKSGVGKTSLVYHLAWMLREIGHTVLAIDLDPQSNLTSAFLEEDDLELLWPQGEHANTILGAIDPLIQSLGDIRPLQARRVADGLFLVPGDLGLSLFEDRLSEAWSKCLDDNPANAGDGFRVMTAFHRVIDLVADAEKIDITLVDVGPNVGAMNRAALVAADHVVIPLGADLFSLQGLRNLGPRLRSWRDGWSTRKKGKVPANLRMPGGAMQPLGYVLLNPSVRSNRPVKAYRRWADRIPAVYANEVLGVPTLAASADPSQLAMIKHFKSLMPMAQDARKPMFLLKPADGAIGGHAAAVQDCDREFRALAQRILAAERLEGAARPRDPLLRPSGYEDATAETIK